MNWLYLQKKKNRQVVINTLPPNTSVNIKTNTAPINMDDNEYISPKPPTNLSNNLFNISTSYKEPTDKELIKGLDEGGNYEAACRIQELKKEVAGLKRKLTILQKKYDEKNN